MTVIFALLCVLGCAAIAALLVLGLLRAQAPAPRPAMGQGSWLASERSQVSGIWRRHRVVIPVRSARGCRRGGVMVVSDPPEAWRLMVYRSRVRHTQRRRRAQRTKVQVRVLPSSRSITRGGMSRRQRRAMLHRGRTSARGNGKAQVWTNGTPSDAHVVAWRAHREGRIRRAHALWIRGNIGAVKAMGLLKEAKNYRPECRTTAELLTHGAYLVRRRALRPASPQPAARYRYVPEP